MVDSVPPERWEEGAGTIRSSSLGGKLSWAGEKGTITCRKETSLTEFFLCMSLCFVFMYIISLFPHMALGVSIRIPVFQMRQLKLRKVS